jgi:hypothetical protein
VSGSCKVTGTGVLPDSDRVRPYAGKITGDIIYRASSFTPALPAFAIPAGCPEEVALPLRQSFKLFIIALAQQQQRYELPWKR